jgi:hypothetical protein
MFSCHSQNRPQSGMVDATGYGNITWKYDLEYRSGDIFAVLEIFGAPQAWGAEVITGEGNERTACSVRAARTANRRVALTRLRQRRNCEPAEDGAKNGESSLQPVIPAFWNYRWHQAG